jgi:predicted RNase H-like HicB family nuclease
MPRLAVTCRHAGRSDTVSLVNDELRVTVRYMDAGDGWVTAQVAEIPGAVSQGTTRDEARANVIDALAVVLTPDEEFAGALRSDDSESLTLTVAS